MLDAIKNKLFPAPADEVDEVSPAPADEVDEVSPAPADEVDEVSPAPADEVDEVSPAPADEVDEVSPAPADEVDEVDALKERLFTALVVADGRLANPEDMTYSPALLDGEALTAAISKRLEDNPRLGRNFAAGDVGAGNRGTAPRHSPDLMDILKAAHNM